MELSKQSFYNLYHEAATVGDTQKLTRGNQTLTAPKKRQISSSAGIWWNFLGENSVSFLRTNSRNNFESWQDDVVSHFRFDVKKDHSGGAANQNSSNSSVELELFLPTFAGLLFTTAPRKI